MSEDVLELLRELRQSHYVVLYAIYKLKVACHIDVREALGRERPVSGRYADYVLEKLKALGLVEEISRPRRRVRLFILTDKGRWFVETFVLPFIKK